KFDGDAYLTHLCQSAGSVPHWLFRGHSATVAVLLTFLVSLDLITLLELGRPWLDSGLFKVGGRRPHGNVDTVWLTSDNRGEPSPREWCSSDLDRPSAPTP